MNLPKLLCIVGPTATGKTDIALAIAHKMNGELIACDSRQVYKGLDLGTGKEAANEFVIVKGKDHWEVDGVKIWLYDVADPKEQYSASQYMQDAKEIIDRICSQKKLPIIVGGTGLYLQALLDGVDTARIAPDKELREKLEQKTVEELRRKLQVIAPQTFGSLNNSERNNKRRLIRKIEIAESADQQIGSQIFKGLKSDFDVLKIGLTAPKTILNERIDKRIIKRINQGMLDEARLVHIQGISFQRMRQLGLEYRIMADFLDGVIPNESRFVSELQQKIKQFAKRQLTWFKRDSEIKWIDITEKDFSSKVEKLVRSWYNPRD